MLIDRNTWPFHRSWVIFVMAATVAATIWYLVEGMGAGTWPGGSSRSGLTFGILGGLIIVFEMLLWFRKKVRVWRIGRAQVWMRAHIWLGLLCVPLLVYHSGFRLGGTLSTVLMVLLGVVIASGIWGLVLQQWLPSRLLTEVPAETIYSQIDYVVGHMCEEAQRLVRAVCGPAEGEEEGAFDETSLPAAGTTHLVVGAMRTAGRVQGKVLETRAPTAPVPGSEPLRAFFRSAIEPFLWQGAASRLPLQYPIKAAAMFQDLRTHLDPAAHGAVDILENFCQQRRQLDHQARLHFWLHNWLWLHLPLSAALFVLMMIHVWVALKYW